MSETATRSWVWHSTPASRAEGKTSLLALLETTLCVAAYWALWKWLGVNWHHWLIVMATPLVLLRSEQSVTLGAKWYDGYSVSRATLEKAAPHGLFPMQG